MSGNILKLEVPIDVLPVSVEYAAAFIDADGCITCSKNGSGNPQWELNVVQSDNNDPGGNLLLAFKARWGGSVCKQGRTSEKHSDVWRWKVQGIEAAIAIQDLYHYLVVKKGKATQALEHFANDPKIGRIMYRIGEAR